MSKRFVSIWFRYLKTDWFSLRNTELKKSPLLIRAPEHGRMVITAVNAEAEIRGIFPGMVLADARAIHPEVKVFDDKTDLVEKLLTKLADWSIRFTPVVAIDPPDGLIFDATGCSHLWGGDEAYVSEITKRLQFRGYDVRVAMVDTVGVAWGMARYGREPLVIAKGQHIEALLNLPPEALRIEQEAVTRLHKLGLRKVSQFVNISHSSLRKRFGPQFIAQMNMALGRELEVIKPLHPIEPYQERLPCLEPIVTPAGIEIALLELLKTLCFRLLKEQKGLRKAIFRCYRVDGKVLEISIGTHRPSHDTNHLFKLFSLKLNVLEPDLGFELFVLDAHKVEDHLSQQSTMWQRAGGLEDERLAQLMDRLAMRIGEKSIHRYLPDEHYWPERSLKAATCLNEKSMTTWGKDKLRPLQLFKIPEKIEVTAPIPDYPPMLFRYKGKIHKVVKADGPERIEQEWWIQQGQHRDYYSVEDEQGQRYWLFRSGHYHDKIYQWFLHGIFA